VSVTEEQLRVLIRDNGTPQVWTPEELAVFIALEDDPWLCAADVLDAWAIDAAKVAVSYRMTDGTSADKRGIEAALRALANQYREKAKLKIEPSLDFVPGKYLVDVTGTEVTDYADEE
jgi:nitrate reductase alpha subunit